MNRIENGIYARNGLTTETHKFSDTLRSMWGKDSKHILTCLYCNKWYKINIWHSDAQKYFANKKWY